MSELRGGSVGQIQYIEERDVCLKPLTLLILVTTALDVLGLLGFYVNFRIVCSIYVRTIIRVLNEIE